MLNMVYVGNMQNMFNMQYLPADRLMLLQSHGVSVLPYHHRKEYRGSLCFGLRGEEIFSGIPGEHAHFLQHHYHNLALGDSFSLIYDWHPTDIIPA